MNEYNFSSPGFEMTKIIINPGDHMLAAKKLLGERIGVDPISIMVFINGVEIKDNTPLNQCRTNNIYYFIDFKKNGEIKRVINKPVQIPIEVKDDPFELMVKSLMSLGFERNIAIDALTKNRKNLDEAANFLLENPKSPPNEKNRKNTNHSNKKQFSRVEENQWYEDKNEKELKKLSKEKNYNIEILRDLLKDVNGDIKKLKEML